MRNQDKYNIDNVRELLFNKGIVLLENKYVDEKTKMLCKDKDGYFIYIVLNNFLHRNGIGRRFDKSNDYTIQNINHYLKLNGVKTLKPSLRFFIIILVQHTLNYTCYFFSEPSWLKAGFSRVALPTASSCVHIGLPCQRTL